MFAHVTNGIVDQVGGLPRLIFADGRWWDLRPKDPELLASLGWYEVTETTRPADTETATSDLSYVFADGTVTQTWTVRDKTPEELAADAELAVLEAREQARDALLTATLALSEQAHTDGQAWAQPTGAHDAYPLGAAVTHGGKTWESLVAFNVWEPGVSGWRETVTDGYPEWVQPTGAHDAYQTGDRVTFEGHVWESLIEGNVWSPVDYPAGWADLGPTE